MSNSHNIADPDVRMLTGIASLIQLLTAHPRSGTVSFVH